jgi:acyl carrier protein
MDRKLAGLLAEVFNLREADITPELTKADVGNWDSLKQMDLVVSLEREYDLSLEIPDIVRMTSVGAIMEVLREKGVSLGN